MRWVSRNPCSSTGGVGVPEDQGELDLPRAQHLEGIDRVGVDEIQLDSGVRPSQFGGRTGNDRAEHGLEAGQPYSPGAKTKVCGQLDRCRVDPPDDLRRSLGQQLAPRG
jgi:hypothetical protein